MVQVGELLCVLLAAAAAAVDTVALVVLCGLWHFFL
jgi:hypothetical protein